MKLRWREWIIAFLMAVVLWYGVSGSEKVESLLDVRVDYRGLPQGLVVRSGMVNKVAVRVRASAGMLRSLTGRDFAFFMDLSDVRKGENVLAINLSYLPFRSGVEVMEVSPSRISLIVDTVESKSVPLEADITGELPVDHIAQVVFTPPEVVLTGASSVLDTISKLVVPVTLDSPVTLGVTDSKRLLPLPEGIDARPPEVQIARHIGIKRKLVVVTRTVQVDTPAQFGKFVRPDKVTISVAVPESQAGKAAANSAIQASAVPDRMEYGSHDLPVTATLPENAELVSIDPPRVTVTLEQRQASPSPATPPARKK